MNFSDPWPKDRHARRRLTSPPFMAVYDQILQKDGRVEFKTDNQDLFPIPWKPSPEAGWHITEYTRDLHHSEMAEGNVMTEYEQSSRRREADLQAGGSAVGKSLLYTGRHFWNRKCRKKTWW